MKIRKLLTQKSVTVSYELFPPKKESAVPMHELVKSTVCQKPDFVSVTCGAAGSHTAAKNNIAMAADIRKCGGNPLAHLTCVSASKSDIDTILQELNGCGVENILALRGDLPENGEGEGSFRYAYQLVERIKKQGDFSVGAACYPEGHVECQNQEQDLINLRKKVDSGVDFLITQMFFDNNILYRFLYKALAKGIHVPVIAGVMPVTNKAQIQRITKVSGTALPPRFLNILDKFGDKPDAMRQAGITYATEQITDLIANGVRGVHIYTMNHPEIAEGIVNNISCLVENDLQPGEAYAG